MYIVLDYTTSIKVIFTAVLVDNLCYNHKSRLVGLVAFSASLIFNMLMEQLTNKAVAIEYMERLHVDLCEAPEHERELIFNVYDAVLDACNDLGTFVTAIASKVTDKPQ